MKRKIVVAVSLLLLQGAVFTAVETTVEFADGKMATFKTPYPLFPLEKIDQLNGAFFCPEAACVVLKKGEKAAVAPLCPCALISVHSAHADKTLVMHYNHEQTPDVVKKAIEKTFPSAGKDEKLSMVLFTKGLKALPVEHQDFAKKNRLTFEGEPMTDAVQAKRFTDVFKILLTEYGLTSENIKAKKYNVVDSHADTHFDSSDRCVVVEHGNKMYSYIPALSPFDFVHEFVPGAGCGTFGAKYAVELARAASAYKPGQPLPFSYVPEDHQGVDALKKVVGYKEQKKK